MKPLKDAQGRTLDQLISAELVHERDLTDERLTGRDAPRIRALMVLDMLIDNYLQPADHDDFYHALHQTVTVGPKGLEEQVAKLIRAIKTRRRRP